MLSTALGLLLSVSCLAQERSLVQADSLFDLPEVDGPVLPAEDVDGDGQLDLFVQKGEGAAHALEVVSLEGKTLVSLWTGEGSLTWDAGGDVNGDGVADLILGLPRWRLPPAGERAGVVQVLSGADGSLLRHVTGEAADDRVGCAVAFVGDVDGDGRDDFALGAMAGDGVEGTEVDGHMIRLASARRGWVALHSGRTGEELWRVEGGPHGHGFGSRVHAMGDMDGDGVQDLMVKCARRSPEPITLLSSGDGSRLGAIDPAGQQVWPAGDVDADGTPDLIFESSGSAAVRGYGDRSTLLLAVASYDLFAEEGMVVSLGDIDGDGCADIALGDPEFYVPGPLDTGSSFSSNSGSGRVLVTSGGTGEVLCEIMGRPGSADRLGSRVASIPDVTGDGLPDLVVHHSAGASIFAGPGKQD